MAGFELVRFSAAREAAREWQGLRYAPLYLAGLALGAAAGVAMAVPLPLSWTPGSASPALVAPAVIVSTPPRFQMPSLTLAGPDTAVTFEPAFIIPLHQPLIVPELFPAPEIPVPAPEVAQIVPEPAAPPLQTSAPVASKPVAAPKPAAAPQPAAPPPPPPAPVAQAKPNFHLPEAPAGGITDLEQRLLSGINAEREAAGLKPYRLDAGLAKIARIRSQQMVDQGYFGHVDPYGYSMYVELLAHFGFGYAWAGENLALNNYGVHESPERALITLMNSPTHRANILAGDFFRIGIGEITTADGRHFYTMIFLG